MKVLFISSEALPFAKTGGLGDVIGALPGELLAQGIDARVMLPLYQSVKERFFSKLTFLTSFETVVAWRKQYCGIFYMIYNGVTFYFLDNEQYFKREGYYGYYDDGERFTYFSKAALDAVTYLDFDPEILHCSEWQTAMVPIYLKTVYKTNPRFQKLRTVFTIHNIEYQGVFGKEVLSDMLGVDARDFRLLEFNGDINFMKGAIVACDSLTTVSPTYAEELTYDFYGNGLSDIIKQNEYKLSGILNGIDRKLFNPAKDGALAANYTLRTIEKKKQNKAALQRSLGLSEKEDIPLIGMVGRFVKHKGMDLILRVFDELMREPVQFVILGTGERAYEGFFLEKAWQYKGRMAAVTAFSGDLANQIYAGSDLFLMPSVSEPCGLSQMIALRYGTIPIVRETGGLRDSVFPFAKETGKGNGITFASVNAHDMLFAVKRGLALYREPAVFRTLVGNAMKTDYSWKKPAKEYIKIYQGLLK